MDELSFIASEWLMFRYANSLEEGDVLPIIDIAWMMNFNCRETVLHL